MLADSMQDPDIARYVPAPRTAKKNSHAGWSCALRLAGDKVYTHYVQYLSDAESAAKETVYLRTVWAAPWPQATHSNAGRKIVTQAKETTTVHVARVKRYGFFGVPPSQIDIVGPEEADLSFKIEYAGGTEVGEVKAGGSVAYKSDLELTIEFHRGGQFGKQRYRLTAGTYKFVSTSRGWDLKKTFGD